MKNFEKITVTSRDEAWAKAAELFKTMYVRDDSLSEKVGHPIYISITPGHESDHIRDRGSVLELKIGNDSIDICVVNDAEGLDDSLRGGGGATRPIAYRTKTLERLLDIYAFESSRINVEDRSTTMLLVKHEIMTRINETFSMLDRHPEEVAQIYNQLINY